MSPKTGPRTASETVWLKRVPRAMAEGLTGGRSVVVRVISEIKIELQMLSTDFGTCVSGKPRHTLQKRQDRSC